MGMASRKGKGQATGGFCRFDRSDVPAGADGVQLRVRE